MCCLFTFKLIVSDLHVQELFKDVELALSTFTEMLQFSPSRDAGLGDCVLILEEISFAFFLEFLQRVESNFHFFLISRGLSLDYIFLLSNRWRCDPRKR